MHEYQIQILLSTIASAAVAVYAVILLRRHAEGTWPRVLSTLLLIAAVSAVLGAALDAAGVRNPSSGVDGVKATAWLFLAVHARPFLAPLEIAAALTLVHHLLRIRAVPHGG
jgi:hypothetical protein